MLFMFMKFIAQDLRTYISIKEYKEVKVCLIALGVMVVLTSHTAHDKYKYKSPGYRYRICLSLGEDIF